VLRLTYLARAARDMSKNALFCFILLNWNLRQRVALASTLFYELRPYRVQFTIIGEDIHSSHVIPSSENPVPRVLSRPSPAASLSVGIWEREHLRVFMGI
jgi:hypothetical protein